MLFWKTRPLKPRPGVICGRIYNGIISSDMYEFGQEKGESFIKCLGCGMKSFSPHDIRYKYCGNCHIFHTPLGVPEREPGPDKTLWDHLRE
jgi:ribosomal protein L37E